VLDRIDGPALYKQSAQKHELRTWGKNFNDDELDQNRKRDETATLRRYVRRLFDTRSGLVTNRYQ